eukprot:767910-Hanusia_phi.AAC.4
MPRAILFTHSLFWSTITLVTFDRTGVVPRARRPCHRARPVIGLPCARRPVPPGGLSNSGRGDLNFGAAAAVTVTVPCRTIRPEFSVAGPDPSAAWPGPGRSRHRNSAASPGPAGHWTLRVPSSV